MIHPQALFGNDAMQWVLSHASGGGYVVIFALLVACGLGLPLPEDIPLIVSGIFISQKAMRWEIAAPVCWLGILGGDCILYWIGHAFGRAVTQLPVLKHHITTRRLDRVERLFGKYGVGVVAIGRLFAGIRGAMVVAAGASRFDFVKFIIADSLAAIVSGGIFMGIGYWCGINKEQLAHKLHEFRMALTTLAVLLAGALILYAYWRQRRHKTIGDVVIEKAHQAIHPPSPQTPQQPPLPPMTVHEPAAHR